MTHPALDAVAQLIRTQVMTVDYDGIPGLGGKLRAPCLLAQLATLIGVGMESGGRGVPGSRPPVNADALDLWHDIVTAVATWCEHLGIDRRALRAVPQARRIYHRPRLPWWLTVDPNRDSDAQIALAYVLGTHHADGRRVDLADVPDPYTDHETPAAGRLLRSCAADAISRGMPEVADRIRSNAHAWAARIEAMLTGHHEQRGVRGAGCPQCTQIRPYPRGQIGPWAGPQPTTTIIEWREEGTRQVPYRVPAIALIVREQGGETLRWLVCQACGWNDALAESLDETAAQAA